jgi:hypothetical protein
MRTESSSSLETLRAAPLRAALRSVPRSMGIDLLLVHFSDRLHDIETSSWPLLRGINFGSAPQPFGLVRFRVLQGGR